MKRLLTLTPVRHEPDDRGGLDKEGMARRAGPDHRRRPSVAHRARGVRVPPRDLVTYQVASLLLEYPTVELMERVPMLRSAAAEGSGFGPKRANRGNRHLLPMLDRLERVDLATLQSEYVETFDLRRRCCLHLTYYAFGDTRRRGLALLDVKQAYAAAGGELAGEELPDHLSVLLEFAATVDPAAGRVLLLDHRAGIELLRMSLTDRGSAYAGVVAAVTATLPAMTGEGRDVLARLIAQGPPDEEVGMEAFDSGSRPWVPGTTQSGDADETPTGTRS